jgi:hypothetical protein
MVSHYPVSMPSPPLSENPDAPRHGPGPGDHHPVRAQPPGGKRATMAVVQQRLADVTALVARGLSRPAIISDLVARGWAEGTAVSYITRANSLIRAEFAKDLDEHRAVALARAQHLRQRAVDARAWTAAARFEDMANRVLGVYAPTEIKAQVNAVGVDAAAAAAIREAVDMMNQAMREAGLSEHQAVDIMRRMRELRKQRMATATAEQAEAERVDREEAVVAELLELEAGGADAAPGEDDDADA